MRALVTGGAGQNAAYFVSEVTPEALAKAIEELLADPTRRATLSQAGRERARTLSWDDTARGMAAALESAFARINAAPAETGLGPMSVAIDSDRDPRADHRQRVRSSPATRV